MHLLDVYVDSLLKPFKLNNMKETHNFGCLLVDPMDGVAKKKKHNNLSKNLAFDEWSSQICLWHL